MTLCGFDIVQAQPVFMVVNPFAVESAHPLEQENAYLHNKFEA